MKNRVGRLFPVRGMIIIWLTFLAVPWPGWLLARSQAADVTGVWDLTVESQEGIAHPSITLKQRGNDISGVYEGKIGVSELSGTVQGNEIKFTVHLKFQDVQYTISYAGTVQNDTMTGTTRFGNGSSGVWSAKKRKDLH
jgi:D-glucosaminate-6-phosphate ammonia-lyase